MRMKDFRAFVTDLWVRLCTFLLLVLESEVEAFSKGQKEERELKIGDGRRSCGFEVNEKRKKDGEEGRWREKGHVKDQGGLVNRGEPFREPSKSEKEERNLKIGDNRCSCGFEVNQERKRYEKGGCWREKGRVNDQSPLVDGNESSRESSKRHGKGKIDDRYTRKKKEKYRYRKVNTAIGIRVSKRGRNLEILSGTCLAMLGLVLTLS